MQMEIKLIKAKYTLFIAIWGWKDRVPKVYSTH
jgi:hypothetical protein